MRPREISTFTSPQRKGPKEAPGLEHRGCTRGPEWTDHGGCMARTPARVFHKKGGRDRSGYSEKCGGVCSPSWGDSGQGRVGLCVKEVIQPRDWVFAGGGLLLLWELAPGGASLPDSLAPRDVRPPVPQGCGHVPQHRREDPPQGEPHGLTPRLPRLDRAVKPCV